MALLLVLENSSASHYNDACKPVSVCELLRIENISQRRLKTMPGQNPSRDAGPLSRPDYRPVCLLACLARYLEWSREKVCLLLAGSPYDCRPYAALQARANYSGERPARRSQHNIRFKHKRLELGALLVV